MKTTFSLLLCVMCLSMGTSAVAQKYLRKADKAFEIGHFEEAISGYEKFLRKRPDATAEQAKLAASLRMMTRLPEAAKVYEVLAKAGSENPDYAYGYALTLFELGEYGKAVEQLSLAAQLGHPNAAAFAGRLQYAQANQKTNSSWRVSNEFANVAGDDYAPTAFGEFVVYASERNGDGQRLFRSSRDENNFLRIPQPLHKVLTEQINDGPIAYSPSGQLVAYTKNNFQSGERFLPEAGWELSLVFATASEQNDFQQGKAFVHNGPGFSTGFPCFSPEGTRLYFSSDRPGGQGGFDIYYSERTASGWGNPVNLGDQINTPGNEIAPQATGSSLYFSSDYLPGFGGMDIYRADLLGDQVSGVVNLGVGVNSSLDDVGFSVSNTGEFAYFYSNRSGGKGGLDVYRAMRSGKALTIAVVDGKSGKPIPNALLDFSDCGQGNFLTGIDGEYSFRAVDAMSCRPRLRKSGYNSKEFSLNAASLKENQRLIVKLNPEDKITIYEGKVLHSRTGDVLENVMVTAQQKDGAYTSSATTNADGWYEIKLEREATYVISYVSEGMADIDREVSTFDADGAGILSSFAMFPDPSHSLSGNNSMTAVSDMGKAIPSERDLVANSSSGKPGDRVAGSVKPGFAVQVAALAVNTKDISEYQRKLSGLGVVYGKRENNVLRVRIGPFASRQEAGIVRAKAKAAGFGDAFVAKESGGVVVGIDRVVPEVKPTPKPAEQSSSQEKSNVISSSAAKPVVSVPTDIANETGATAGNYLIRLATYGNFTNFDASRVADLGTLTTRKRGEYVVVLVQGFPTAAAAQDKIEAAKAAGFGDAHVVFEDGTGTLRKVR